MLSESCRKKGILHRIGRLSFSTVKITKIFLLNLNLSNEIFSTWRRNEFFELSLREERNAWNFLKTKTMDFHIARWKKKEK